MPDLGNIFIPAPAAQPAGRAFVSCVLAGLLLLLLSSSGAAQIQPVHFSGGGVTSYDGWNAPQLNGWPTATQPNMPNSGSALLSRQIRPEDNAQPVLGGESIYFFAFTQEANDFGSTLRVADASPVAGVRTITLQVQMGEALGYGFFEPSGYPKLKINGQEGGVSPAYTVILDTYQNGTFDSPITGEEPVYVRIWGFQWDIDEGVGVSQLAIDFSAVTHAQVYEVQLDQTDALQSSPVFVPSNFEIVAPGSPTFDGTSTQVTVSFAAEAEKDLAIYFSGDLSLDLVAAPVSTGTGEFEVTFHSLGDHRAEWAQHMFFSAAYPTQPW